MSDEAEPTAAPEGVDPNLDPTDPDAIAARPPAKAIDAKTHFQIGTHEGKWSEYDDRGVPTKTSKKKKPTKKEKDALENEYLDASKAYQKYLKDVENWEQAKLDAEKALKKSDRLRWSFRQIGDKHGPIDPDDMEAIIKLMGWNPLSAQEYKVVKKGVIAIANSDSRIELEALRVYVRDVMPIQLLEEKLMCEQLDSIELEELYSPRTWRGKLEEEPPPKKGKKTSPRGSSSSGRQPSAKKPSGGGGGMSARGGKKKEGSSPRGGGGGAKSSPRGSQRTSAKK